MGLVNKCLIIREIWKILGSICAEDFPYLVHSQMVIDHLFCPIQIVKAQEESLKVQGMDLRSRNGAKTGAEGPASGPSETGRRKERWKGERKRKRKRKRKRTRIR